MRKGIRRKARQRDGGMVIDWVKCGCNRRKPGREPELPGHFDEIEVGQVVTLGVAAVDPAALAAFCAAFAPSWDVEDGAPDPMVFALWSRLDIEASARWPQTKRLGVDALRWLRNPPAGELLRGRMTIFAKDPVGEDKGVVIAQHDLLDEGGRLVFSCLTRSVFSRAQP